MNDESIKNQVNQIIASICGVDMADIKDYNHFILDYNASPDDLLHIKEKIETTLDITLPDFKETPPETVSDLHVMVDDSSL